MSPKIILPIVVVILALLVGVGVYASFASLNPLKDIKFSSSVQSSIKALVDSGQVILNINSKISIIQASVLQSQTVSLPATTNDKPVFNQTKTFSPTELAIHNTEADCYIATLKKVYDVTSYISQHSGGKDILKGCGKALDKVRHPGGSFTGDQIQGILKDFYIGELK